MNTSLNFYYLTRHDCKISPCSSGIVDNGLSQSFKLLGYGDLTFVNHTPFGNEVLKGESCSIVFKKNAKDLHQCASEPNGRCPNIPDRSRGTELERILEKPALNAGANGY